MYQSPANPLEIRAHSRYSRIKKLVAARSVPRYGILRNDELTDTISMT
jgi:hypothetical protein